MAQTIAADRLSAATRHAKARATHASRARESVGSWLFLLPALVFFVGYQV